MPNRIIKESICTSDNLDKLSWFEEVCFYRLIVNCDDFGRMDARPAILRARLFPLKNVTDKQIENALESLRSAAMIDLYDVDGRSYLQMRTWERHQSVRAKRSKYPEPESICEQMYSDDFRCSRNPIQSESESNPNPDPKPIQKTTPQENSTKDVFEGYGFSEAMKAQLSEWLLYKTERREAYKPTGLKSLLSQVRNNLGRYPEGEVIALIGECMASNWKGIIWDKLKGKEIEKPPPEPEPFVAPTPEMDAHVLKIDPSKPFDIMEHIP